MFKKLAACVREYKKNAIVAPIFITFEVIAEVVIPWLMKLLIDRGIDGNSGNGDLG